MSAGGQSRSSQLLSGILQEVSSAKKDTIWSDSPRSVTVAANSNSISPDAPYLFIPSFGALRKQTAVRAPRSPGQRGRTPKQNPTIVPVRTQTPKTPPTPKEPPKTVDVAHPPAHIIKGVDGDWTLRCVCNLVQEDGFMVICDNCNCWQHGICMGVNSHTLPDDYKCDICSGKRIRCKCGNNLSYRFALIKCSVCGYYVHKRCEGLGFGMMPKGDFVCHYCGRSNFRFEKPTLPPEIPVPDTSITFSQPRIEDLPPELTNGPFSEFLTVDLADITIIARDFCELLYDRFRSFFSLCHPKFITNISKKKRNRLLHSFLDACEYMCKTFFGIDHNTFTRIFDALIVRDIYTPHVFDPTKIEEKTDFTENVVCELPRMTNITRFPAVPRQAKLMVTSSGDVIANTDLVADQLITLVDGYVGDLEEYNVEGKVDAALFLISDTRFVLDCTWNASSILHHIPRGMNGNCQLRLMQVGDSKLVGLFAARTRLTLPSSDDPALVIKAGSPLVLGIDFIPAVLDDVSRWMSWHFIEQEEPQPAAAAAARPRSESSSALSRAAAEKERLKGKAKKKAGRRKKPTPMQQQTELTLFGLMCSDSPGDFLFMIANDLDELEEDTEDFVRLQANPRLDNPPPPIVLTRSPSQQRNTLSSTTSARTRVSNAGSHPLHPGRGHHSAAHRKEMRKEAKAAKAEEERKAHRREKEKEKEQEKDKESDDETEDLTTEDETTTEQEAEADGDAEIELETEETEEEIPSKSGKSVIGIFNEEAVESITKRSSSIGFTPSKIGNTGDDMRRILGL